MSKKAEQLFSETSENKLKGEIGFPQIPNLDALITALNDGVIPIEFFHGSQKREFGEKLSRKFTPECQDLIKKNKIFSHIDSGNIFLTIKIVGKASMILFGKARLQQKLYENEIDIFGRL